MPIDACTSSELADAAPPFFITGSGRCGTTLLRRILLNEQSLVIPPENYALRRTHIRWKEHSALGWDSFVNATIESLAAQENWPDFKLDAEATASALRAITGETKTPWLLWMAFHAIYARAHGRAPHRWGDKTPLAADRVSALATVFPGARVVHPIRDAYDVIASLAKVPILQGQYVRAATRWVAANTAIDAFAREQPAAVLRIRYEDLVQSPETTVRSVCKFLDFPFASSMLEGRDDSGQLADTVGKPHFEKIAEPIQQQKTGGGFNKIPPQFRSEINYLISELQDSYGYNVQQTIFA